MFDDEKIKLIRSLPEGNSIILVWIQLLSIAGKTNDDGMIYIGRNLAYSDEMLATIFDHPLSTIRLALLTLKDFELIETNPEGVIRIANWEKHQNVEGMERIREQTRKRVAKHRERQKQIEEESSVTLQETLPNATEKIREDKNRVEKNREDKDNDKIVVNPIQFYESNGFGTIAPMIVEQVGDWASEFEEAGNTKEEAGLLIIKAMEFGVTANIKKWAYVNKILTNWQQRGLMTMDKIEAAEIQRAHELESKKTKPSYSKPPARKESLPEWANENKPKEKDKKISEEEQAAFKERLQKIRAQRG